ncbi:universal stress protein [Winogradskyella jejuensis]|uniref:Nucleotide-binding universal stress protein, UspA family n=1 Tax=Winogradskyella jejuensis TaxID=1089305 RepID=A0A1M5UUT3_9FLAO|nr:universal stress protein [Winogradskyella jejuensis]SHH66670.1 Nucleotide-binding universal stress protein, UspA family [Winogradskyella jejuensis]
MKRRILLPTDFSDNSWSAIVYALKLFKDEECIFYLLNSIALKASTISNFSNSLLKVMKENALKELDALKKQIETADANANHEFYNVLSTQDLYDAIKFEVKQNNIDLIVMGTKGATGAKEIFLGSNTIRVIKKIKNCPILIVPDEYDYVIPRQITFPTDFKKHYREEELNTLKSIVELHDSKIRVLHINEEEELSITQEKNCNNLKAELSNFKLSFHWMPDYSTKETEINEFIKDLGINILFMVNYKRSLIEKIMNEPVIKKIGLQPVIPFLVISS